MKVLFILLPLVYSCLAIWPIPQDVKSGNVTRWVNPSRLEISVQTGALTPPNIPSATWRYHDQSETIGTGYELGKAFSRFHDRLAHLNFEQWKFFPRGSHFGPDAQQRAEKNEIKRLMINLKGSYNSSFTFRQGDLGIDESYNLTVPSDGDAVVLSAKTAVGMVRGLTTFQQLFSGDQDGWIYTTMTPVTVLDEPRFKHRGINLDVSRHYYPPKTLHKLLDAMEFNKLNRLHLHVTDAQSWPLEIDTLPDLAAKGAYAPGLTYTSKVMRELQSHAADLGIELYLEIDMPGHTASIGHAYPELIAAFNKQPDWGSWGASPPSGTLKLNSSKVNKFVDDLFQDLLVRVKKVNTHFHTGGDEVNLQAYTEDETVKSKEFQVIRPYLQAFIDRIHTKIRSAGMTPIVWQEMALDWHLTLDKDVIVQAWQDSSAIDSITRLGHRVIVGTNDFWYLDCGQGQWTNPAEISNVTGYEGCSPRKNWRRMYSYDPLSGLNEEQQKLVVGGECHLWSEQTDEANLDSMLWPRASAVAEVLWSGPIDRNGAGRDPNEAARRLSEHRERMVAMGIMAEPIQMPFCLMNENQCNG